MIFAIAKHAVFSYYLSVENCFECVSQQIADRIYSSKNLMAVDAFGMIILSKISFICLKIELSFTFSFWYSTSHVDDKISQTFIEIIINVQDSWLELLKSQAHFASYKFKVLKVYQQVDMAWIWISRLTKILIVCKNFVISGEWSSIYNDQSQTYLSKFLIIQMTQWHRCHSKKRCQNGNKNGAHQRWAQGNEISSSH